jgi:hypothetical protein
VMVYRGEPGPATMASSQSSLISQIADNFKSNRCCRKNR